MNKIKTSLVAAIAVGLLAGAAAGVGAQSPERDQDVVWPQLTKDFVYGGDDTSKQVVHVIEPEPREAARPAVVFFHTGGLVGGTPLDDMTWAQALAEQGYVTFMSGYRLFVQSDGTDPWPAQLEDAQRAVRWIRAHADDFGVDPDRICAMGHSSGGQLAGLLGTTESEGDLDPALAGVSSRVDCVVTVAGDADLTVPYEATMLTRLNEGIFGGTLAEQREVYEAASPAHNVDESTVPFLVLHGVDDEWVPVQMARNLVAELTAAEREVVYAERPRNHMGIKSDTLSWELIVAFLSDQLDPQS